MFLSSYVKPLAVEELVITASVWLSSPGSSGPEEDPLGLFNEAGGSHSSVRVQ